MREIMNNTLELWKELDTGSSSEGSPAPTQSRSSPGKKLWFCCSNIYSDYSFLALEIRMIKIEE